MNIDVKRYYYTGEYGMETGKEKIGIIAQEVQPYAPYMFEKKNITSDLKNTGGESTLKDVLIYNSSALQYILLNAIKELNDKLEDLEMDYKLTQKQLRNCQEQNQIK